MTPCIFYGCFGFSLRNYIQSESFPKELSYSDSAALSCKMSTGNPGVLCSKSAVWFPTSSINEVVSEKCFILLSSCNYKRTDIMNSDIFKQ